MKLKLLVVVLALQTAWILGTTLQQEKALRTGRIILLETERVDPRDLLRGDYLILNYKISNVRTNLFSPSVHMDMEAGTKMYIALQQRGEFFEVARASTNRFEPSENEVLLKATSGWRRWGGTNAIRAEYGLERYYVTENTGNPQGKLTVQAVVTSSGRASIKEVLLDGKPYAKAMKNSVP